MGQETTIYIETVRVPPVRADMGPLAELGDSIEKEGLRHPITIWSDGTLVSGARRLRAHFLLAGTPDKSEYRKIRAVIVDNIEDAAKRLLNDNGDEAQSVPLKHSEMCRLWDVIRQLDAPAAARRLDEARRQGVELRRQTQAGQRRPGRSRSRARATNTCSVSLVSRSAWPRRPPHASGQSIRWPPTRACRTNAAQRPPPPSTPSTRA